MVFEVMFGLSHVEPLYPHNVFLFGGILKYVRLSYTLTKLFADVLLFIMSVVVISTALLFLFRYAQTVDGWLCRSMSKPQRAASIILALLVVVAGTISVPIHATMATYDEIAVAFANNTELLEVIEGRNVFSFKVKRLESTEFCFGCMLCSFRAPNWPTLRPQFSPSPC